VDERERFKYIQTENPPAVSWEDRWRGTIALSTALLKDDNWVVSSLELIAGESSASHARRMRNFSVTRPVKKHTTMTPNNTKMTRMTRLTITTSTSSGATRCFSRALFVTGKLYPTSGVQGHGCSQHPLGIFCSSICLRTPNHQDLFPASNHGRS